MRAISAASGSARKPKVAFPAALAASAVNASQPIARVSYFQYPRMGGSRESVSFRNYRPACKMPESLNHCRAAVKVYRSRGSRRLPGGKVGAPPGGRPAKFPSEGMGFGSRIVAQGLICEAFRGLRRAGRGPNAQRCALRWERRALGWGGALAGRGRTGPPAPTARQRGARRAALGPAPPDGYAARFRVSFLT